MSGSIIGMEGMLLMSTFDAIQQAMVDELTKVPGVQVRTGIPCRTVKPCGPEVHNLHMTECHGMLLHHEGPHSWEK